MANIRSVAFTVLMPSAFRTGVEVTLSQLFVALELDAGMPILQKAESVVSALRSIGLALYPSINEGDFESSRIMRCPEQPPVTVDSITAEIVSGEAEILEFKSSYLFNVEQAKAAPALKPHELACGPIVHSALKTICAFANSKGGTLLIGIRDDGSCVGIEQDYPIVSVDGQAQRDKWQLRLRTDIEGQFKEGRSINEFVSVSFVPFDAALTVARIVVLPRRKLTFLRREKGPGYCPYKRQGNRSIEIPYEEIEDFLLAKHRD